LPGESDWVIVASFASVGEWHNAASALNHANIPSREAQDPSDPAANALAVLSVEAEAARQVLSQLTSS
jgi:hypothetical protein